MNIYFAGSVHTSNDRKISLSLVEYLQHYGELLSVPGNVKSSQIGDAAQDMYFQQVDLLRKSDVVIAEVTTPSLDVGYKLCFAEMLKKPTLCLYRPQPDTQLAPTVLGNPFFSVIAYNNLDEGLKSIDRYFEEAFHES